MLKRKNVFIAFLILGLFILILGFLAMSEGSKTDNYYTEQNTTKTVKQTFDNEDFYRVCCYDFSQLDQEEMKSILSYLNYSPLSISDSYKDTFWSLINKYQISAETVNYMKKVVEKSALLNQYFWQDAQTSYYSGIATMSPKRKQLLDELIEINFIDSEVNKKVTESFIQQIADKTAEIKGMPVDEEFFKTLENYDEILKIIDNFFTISQDSTVLSNTDFFNVCCSRFTKKDKDSFVEIFQVLTLSPYFHTIKNVNLLEAFLSRNKIPDRFNPFLSTPANVSEKDYTTFWSLVNKYKIDDSDLEYIKLVVNKANQLGKYFWSDAFNTIKTNKVENSVERSELLNELSEIGIVNLEIEQDFIQPFLKQIADPEAVLINEEEGVIVDEEYIYDMWNEYKDAPIIIDGFFSRDAL